MVETVLIPGYATEFSTLFRPARGIDGGFGAFSFDVGASRAVVYRWGIREHVPLHRAISPLYLISLYWREYQLAIDDTTFQALNDFLQTHTPRKIICHSMGCLLLAEYLKKYSLPESIRQIVFVQADLPVSAFVETNVPLKNFFCPWDPTLWLSTLFHRAIPVGLVGAKGARVSNQLFSLWRLPNLHTSSMRDSRLLTLL